MDVLRSSRSLQPDSRRRVLFRSTWPWVLVVAATLIAQDLLNVFRPFATAGRSGQLFLVVLLMEYTLAGVWVGVRTRQAATGTIATVTAHVVGFVVLAVWWAATAHWFVAIMERNPIWINAWQSNDGASQTFSSWLFWDDVGGLLFGGGMFAFVAAALGAVGSTFGSMFISTGSLQAAHR